ncbi:MAG: sulfite exporter TauE/SafE family protein [Melioribacteraceae bacterium]|nr:sulfite exporter TauE/SafE family protein [Melioribacteraceae bacterium]
MNSEITILLLTATTIGFVHTVLGPDHYIPFIVLSKSEKWSKLKTSIVTLLCGAGHVLSSIVIGVVGFVLGVKLFSLEAVEAFRGEIAGWLLITFGLLYTVWGIKQSYKNKAHSHIHYHQDGEAHEHTHTHKTEHSHLHTSKGKKLTPWVIFIVFILGPCEPLIPLLIFPAASFNVVAVIAVASLFSFVTLVTMQAMVFIGIYGLSFFPLQKIETHIHSLAGGSILLCGISIQFLGL